jgi:hypothetical protein
LPGAPFGGYKMSAYGRVPAIQQMEKYLNVKAFDQDSIGKRRGGFPVKPPANSAQGHATPRLTLRINFNKDSASVSKSMFIRLRLDSTFLSPAAILNRNRCIHHFKLLTTTRIVRVLYLFLCEGLRFRDIVDCRYGPVQTIGTLKHSSAQAVSFTDCLVTATTDDIGSCRFSA